MFQLIGRARSERSLRTLRLDDALTNIARMRSRDMVNRDYFAHTAPDGTTFFTMLENAKITYSYAGEIIANNNYSEDQTSQVAFDGFMNSVHHRDILLSDRYTLVGVGEAANSKGFHYFTVVFLVK